MSQRVIAALLVLTAFAGCATDRYQWNLTHALVTPWTHLSTADHAAIIRLISAIDNNCLHSHAKR